MKKNKNMKGPIFLLCAITMFLLSSCIENVERLSYGVKYDTCQPTLNIDDLTIVYGKWNKCGACCEISEFPTTPMVKSFQKVASETSEEGTHFVIPIGTSTVEFDYNIEFQIKTEEDAKKCFMACKAGKDFDSYVRNNMKNQLRDIFKNEMRAYKTPESLIDSTAQFESKCFLEIHKRLLEDGITVERANLINNFRWPPNVANTLSEILEIKATTMKSESAARAAELDSKARIIAAEANSKAEIIEAEAAAKVSSIEAKADADRIRLVNAALTPAYLRLKEIETYKYKTEYITPQGGIIKLSQKEAD